MTDFLPTHLYIKQHTITWKLYFGKTVSIDPVKYVGSGSYWQSHIKKHGKENVVTLWHCLFTDQVDCTAFALEFSKKMDIVKSDQWLNLMDEDGLGNFYKGMTHSEETREKIGAGQRGKPKSIEQRTKMSAASLGKPKSATHRANIVLATTGVKQFSETIAKRVAKNKGQIRSEEQCLKISNAMKGKNKRKIHSKITCPHCNLIGGIGAMKRSHLDKCKKRLK